MKKRYLNAFSLMEMMVVLLIVAIIAAATAPMVTKKMMRNAGSGDSPWVFTGLGNSIAYNMNGGDATAIIGSTSYNAGNGPRYPRLFINTDGNVDHASIVFGTGGNYTSQITLGDTTAIFGDAQLGDRSVGIGMGQFDPNNNNTPSDVVVVGNGANVSNDHSVAVGHGASTGLSSCIAIGDNASAGEQSNPQSHTAGESIAIGEDAFTAGHWSIALGHYAGVGKTTKDGEGVDSSIAIGDSSRTKARSAIAIGAASRTIADYAIALGYYSEASGERSTAIGHNAQVTGEYAIAIGDNTEATGKGAVALGTGYTTTGIFGSKKHKCVASGKQSTAIGFGAEASGIQSTAIGWCAKATETNQIVLGTINDTVYIPGNIIIGGNMVLANKNAIYFKAADNRWYNQYDRGKTYNADRYYIRVTQDSVSLPSWASKIISDRRLKNVGEKYTAGLDELKKLDFYHYTFKKDEAKTPMVGVMAQDLQKVFPDAVTKGEDGYLRIRLEDMFYAVINAVKELDSKISEILENINGINSKIEKLEKENAELQKVNSDLLKTNSELQEEIKNIEKRIEKLEK